MLVESVNMQLEAELADLLDRSTIALYGQKKDNKPNSKIKEKILPQVQDQTLYNETAREYETSSYDLNQAQGSSSIQDATATFQNKALDKLNQQLPIQIEQRCLNCSHNSHDTQMTIKLFKTACLSYKPSDVEYRG